MDLRLFTKDFTSLDNLQELTGFDFDGWCRVGISSEDLIEIEFSETEMVYRGFPRNQPLFFQLSSGSVGIVGSEQKFHRCGTTTYAAKMRFIPATFDIDKIFREYF